MWLVDLISRKYKDVNFFFSAFGVLQSNGKAITNLMVEASSRNITMNMPNIYWISSMHMNKNSALTYMHYQDGMNRTNLLV